MPFHKKQKINPNKAAKLAPTGGLGATNYPNKMDKRKKPNTGIFGSFGKK